MKVRVYRSLDRSSSLFGIRGSFLRIAGAGAGAAVILGFGLIGPATDSLVGTVSAILLVGLDYLGVMALQSRFSEKGLDRWMSTLHLPRYILVPPRRLSRYAGGGDGSRRRDGREGGSREGVSGGAGPGQDSLIDN